MRPGLIVPADYVDVVTPDWVVPRNPGGGVGLAFQPEPDDARPVWPAGPDDHAPHLSDQSIGMVYS